MTTRDMNHQISYSLSSLHEFAQLQLDRKTDFMVSAQFANLACAEQLHFRGAMADVTASLGRLTAAVFRIDGRRLETHLPELFDRLAALESASKSIGAPTATGAFEMYRKACLPEKV
jgi:hypothetical protein